MAKLDPGKRYRPEPRSDGSTALVEVREPTPPPREPLRPRLSLKEAFGRLTGRSDPEPTTPEPEAETEPNATIAVGDADLARVDQAERRRDAELVAPDSPPPALVTSERRRWRGGACAVCGTVRPLRRRAVRIGDALGRVCVDCPDAATLNGEHQHLNGADATTAVLRRAEDELSDAHPVVALLKSAWNEADRRDGLASVEVGGQYLKLDVPRTVAQHLTWGSGAVPPNDDVADMPFWFVATDAAALDPPAAPTRRRDPRRLTLCPWCGSSADPDPGTATITINNYSGTLCGACAVALDQEPADQPGRGLLDRLVDELPADTNAARAAARLVEAAWQERAYRDLWVDGEHRARRERLTFAEHVRRTRRAGAGDPDQDDPVGAPFAWHCSTEEAIDDAR